MKSVWVNRSSCSCAAATTSGWLWPTFRQPTPPAKSMKVFPSRSVRVAPRADSATIGKMIASGVATDARDPLADLPRARPGNLGLELDRPRRSHRASLADAPETAFRPRPRPAGVARTLAARRGPGAAESPPSLVPPRRLTQERGRPCGRPRLSVTSLDFVGALPADLVGGALARYPLRWLGDSPSGPGDTPLRAGTSTARTGNLHLPDHLLSAVSPIVPSRSRRR